MSPGFRSSNLTKSEGSGTTRDPPLFRTRRTSAMPTLVSSQGRMGPSTFSSEACEVPNRLGLSLPGFLGEFTSPGRSFLDAREDEARRTEHVELLGNDLPRRSSGPIGAAPSHRSYRPTHWSRPQRGKVVRKAVGGAGRPEIPTGS